MIVVVLRVEKRCQTDDEHDRQKKAEFVSAKQSQRIALGRWKIDHEPYEPSQPILARATS